MKRCWMFGMLVMYALGVLAGCASEPYRLVAGTGSSDTCSLDRPAGGTLPKETLEGACAKAWSVRVPGSHGVNYVEVDEQGILNNRAAMEDAIRFAGAPSSAAGGAYVVVFIHGWHHNASANDENVNAFHGALAAIKRWHPDADVRGVYIGWRGASLPLPLGYLTFWDRKNTSDEVGRGGLLEFLLRLERAVKQTPDSQHNRLVLVGHSFGASVAFNALAHVFLERFLTGVYTTDARPRFRGYGDLVVLINPAIEAMRFMPFESALRYYAEPPLPGVPRLDFSHDALPRLVILSSTGDVPTRKVFPAARFFSTSLEQHDVISTMKSPGADDKSNYSEWVMDLQTVGNYERFKTHSVLKIAEDAPAAKPDGDTKVVKLSSGEVNRCRALDKAEIRRLLSIPQRPQPPRAEDAFPDSAMRFFVKEGSIPSSPYIVADIDTKIVPDHSDIDSLNLICWINQVVDGND